MVKTDLRYWKSRFTLDRWEQRLILDVANSSSSSSSSTFFFFVRIVFWSCKICKTTLRPDCFWSCKITLFAWRCLVWMFIDTMWPDCFWSGEITLFAWRCFVRMFIDTMWPDCFCSCQIIVRLRRSLCCQRSPTCCPRAEKVAIDQK